ncbi:hypothetical protein Tco_1568101 [Tanacetum coccineum]
MPQTLSCIYRKLDICDVRTSYVSHHQCTISDGDDVAPCLLRGLTTPALLVLASWGTSYSCSAGPCLLGGLATPALLDAELKTLIATYDIPLDLRPHLPDSNFGMINLLTRDTAIGIYSRIFDSSGVRIPFSSFLLAVLKYFKVHISQLVPLGLSKEDWFSFAKCRGSAPVCMEVTKSGLKQWKEKFFLIDRRAIPFHMPLRHPDSCITDKIPTNFNQDHVDHLKAHIVKLCDIPRGSISIHDFLCMPSLEKAMVQEEPHELGTSILSRVADHTTPPAPVRTDIPRAFLEDHMAKQKTSTGPKISTNTTKRTRLSQKVSGVGPSGLAAGDEVEQTNDGTLDNDDQRDGLEFSMEDIGNLNDVGQGVDGDAFSPAQEAVPATGIQPLDTDVGADEIARDGNVDSYFDARVCNTAGDVLERDLLSFVPEPYYIPYPYDENNRSEIHRLHELSSAKLSDHMSMLQCQLITHGQAFHARYDHSLREVERLAKRCAQQTQAELGALKSKCEATEHKLSSWDKKHRKYRSERDTLAKEKAKIEEELKSRLEHHERQAEEIQGNITSFFQSDFTSLVQKFLKSSKFNRAFAGVLNTEISVGVERGLRMGCIDEKFIGLSQRVASFIPDAKEKFDRVIAAFPDATFPFLDKVSQHSQSSLQDIARLEPDRVTPSSQSSSATASLRTSTHARHSTSSSETFGHTSTPEHLKKKKKPVER